MRSGIGFGLGIVGGLFFTGVLRADDLADQLHDVMKRPEYAHSRFGVLVVDGESGKTLYERESNRLFIPASVTKLYSCAAALAELGADHRFSTKVYRTGEIRDGVLDGNLILVGSGDLTMGGRRGADGSTLYTDGDHIYAGGTGTTKLTDSDPLYALRDLSAQIAKAGVKKVLGTVLIDERLFPRARSTGSGPEVVSSVTINDNLLDILITPGSKPGEPAKVTIRPETQYLRMTSAVKTIEKAKRSGIQVEQVSPRVVRVTGEIAAEAAPIVRVRAVDNPAEFARTLFMECLAKAGVSIAGSMKSTGLPPTDAVEKLPAIAEWKSEPFRDVIKVTLKVSHNLYASTLPILLSRKNGGPGTVADGLGRQGKFIRSIGVDIGGASFGGGAGGATADSASPQTTVELLRAMAKHPTAKDYFDALPILGVDGTLAGIVPKDSPAYGKVRAKTGTLTYNDSLNDRVLLRSKALAGDLTTKNGKRLFFAMFVNDVPLADGITSSREGKMLGKLCEIIHQHAP